MKGGSVQHLDFLTQDEKDVFKTATEMDQMWVIEHAGDRAPFICQAQSVNIFVPANVHKRDLHRIHFQAWKKGVKSLYYCRSTSLQRADKVSHAVATKEQQLEMDLHPKSKQSNFENNTNMQAAPQSVEYEECLACQ